MDRTGTTGRRALLAAGAAATAAALTGCSTDEPGPRPATLRSESAETALRERSAGLSAALLLRYDAVLTAHPALAARLSPLRADVVRHVEALAPTGSRLLPRTPPSPSASRPPSPAQVSPVAVPPGRVSPLPVSPAPAASGPARPAASSPAAPALPPVPADAGAAVRELAAAERSTADAHAAALSAAPPEYARLLASVAAAGAVHAYLLTEGSR
ncbi:hypothetical protein E3E14_09235 [Streptomyces sp. ICN441]|uniref:hypothetical protein n=1 Tax=Streptomyces sp. ICN441 TaxID=2558286 RepID=UPI00106D3550|nr:hypothetical protein [Streptomyces sp. ICN441]TFE53474.1 hypothetical protein E3E14_09235 [Streptomyces sp. ICN441]